MKHLDRLWHGKLALQDAFWNWAVIGGLAINLASSAAFLFLIMFEQTIAAVIVGYGFSLPYNFAVSVGVWRSAERYEGERRWAEYAQMGTVIGMILLSIT